MLWPPKPGITVRDVLNACTTWLGTQDWGAELRARLPELIELEKRYRTAGEAGRLLALLLAEADSQKTDSDKGRFHAVYETALVDRAPGRKLYDALMASAVHNLCPLCGYQPVTQIDHHAPKASFPLWALTPLNLVPACGPCNQGKSNKLAVEAAKEAFHPYFDDLGEERWLFAYVHRANGGITATYFVQAPEHWPETKSKRLQHHFVSHKLAERYAKATSSRLSNRRRRDIRLLTSSGAEELRNSIAEEAASAEEAHPNSLETALLHGLAACDWYLNGGMAVG
ncbi:HNH endonuclease [Streptomyces cinereoruber]|uniref:HNH endonuclease n=1 Tax=Streptomyces cinereoruber TaxID=67260 RepID=UPI00363E8DB7